MKILRFFIKTKLIETKRLSSFKNVIEKITELEEGLEIDFKNIKSSFEQKVGVFFGKMNQFCLEVEKPHLLSNLPYLKLEGNLIITDFPFNLFEKDVLLRLYHLIRETNEENKEERSTLIREFGEIKGTYKVIDLLKKEKLFSETNVHGAWIFSTFITKLMNKVNQKIEELVPEFQELIIPKLINIDDWLLTSHFRKFGNELLYVTRLKSRDGSKTNWSRTKMYFDAKIDDGLFQDMIQIPYAGLTYAQCTAYWNAFRNKTFIEEQLPVLIFDRSGPSYRYEGSAITPLKRLDEFRRFELFLIGTKEQVMNKLGEMKERLIKFFHEELGLKGRIIETEHWSKIEDLNSIDLELYSPSEDSWIECLSLNNNGSHYIEKFKVKSSKKSELFSACIGLGLDRICYCLLAQKGLDRENWPKDFHKCFTYIKDNCLNRML